MTKNGKQATVGILMLDSQFPRIPGDVGNPDTWDFPVIYKVVRDACPDHVVRRGAKGLGKVFITAAQELVTMGASGITTTCGFLSLMQNDLAAAVDIPVASSSLMQVQLVNALLPPGKCAGVLTISGSTLTQAHLKAANVPGNTPIGSTEGGAEFTRAILNNEATLDVPRAREDIVAAATTMLARHPNLGALVLECTNMCPYSNAVSTATGLPVFDMTTFVRWFQSGLQPHRY